ncbi:MAG TPA: RDD family protein [Candidatus Dormibacteraeota bacterium]|nr:RDD family protein [Candidatus Dormibacteraeota bacterium]
MSVAGAPVADPIDVASITGRALPRRFLALFVDTLVISLLDAILNGTFGIERVTSGVATTMGSGGFTSFTTQTTVDWPWLALLWVTYYAVLEGLFGASIGKGLAGLRVTDLEGRRIRPQAAIVRNIARLIDVLPFIYLLGGILTLATRQHQRLGDRFAGTIVVPVSALISPPLEPRVRRRRAVAVAAGTVLLVAFCAVFAYFGRPPLVIEGAKNTSNGIFSEGVSSYTLGSPRWGTGEVTYPITYELARTAQTCRGFITLDWSWYFPRWVFSSGETKCSPRIYP